MKKILVPVDFSKLSDNAVDYAVQLAEHSDFQLTLLHVLYIPIAIHDVSMMLPPVAEQQEEGLRKLEKMRGNLLKNNALLNINCLCVSGIPVEEINAFAEKELIDFIIVGAQGAGYLEERLFGITATLLMRTTRTAVLVINKDVKFRKLENIALAADYIETENNSALKPLKQLAAAFHSQVFVVHVYSEPNIQRSEEIKESFQLAHALKYVQHSFYQVQHDEVVPGINEFVDRHDIQLVAMVARRHSLISRIFHEPYTKQMAFHSGVPLLVLHEQKT